MEKEIKEKILKIKMKEKINEISEENIIELYCIITSLKIKERKKGNEYDKAWIKIKYLKGTIITEYLNIFKIVREPLLFDFVNYFKSIKEKISNQNTDTKLNINEYWESEENISQEIIIIMVFNIETTEEELNIKKEEIKKQIKIAGIEETVFKDV